jgi:hypothetical protein
MNRFSRLAFLLLAGIVLMAPLAEAQDEPPAEATGTVIVVVRGPGGPAVGARVTLDSGGETSYAREGAADPEGKVTLAGVPLGEVAAKAFDADGQLLASGVGYLEKAGEVITLIIGPDPEE